MPNSTTMRMTVVWLSALRFSAEFTSAIRPCATSATMAMVMIGMSAMIGLRKMISSRTRIKIRVANSTIASALLPDCSLSSCWAADPGHLGLVGSGQLAAVVAGEHDDRGGGVNLPGLREGLVLQVLRPDRLVA